MQNEVKHNWHFSQSPQEVWEYLTKPELLEQWLMKTDFQPIVGHKFHFIGGCNHENGEEKVVAVCEVLDVKPFTHLSYSWQANSVKDNKPFNSKVVWTVVPKGIGTELQLVHSGFTVLEDAVLHNDGWTRIGIKMVDFFNVVKV